MRKGMKSNMTKRDYERAATIAQAWVQHGLLMEQGAAVEDAFVSLFEGDNPRFDEARFRRACAPGANVKARPRKVVA